MRWGINAFLVSAVVLAGLIALLAWKPKPAVDRTPLFVYCAAGLHDAVEEIASEYEKAYGVPVRLTFAGSEKLLGQIQASRRGDLYLPADSSYIQKARDRGLLDEDISLATMKVVVGVARGNPKKIRSLEDILRSDVKLLLADPEAAAVSAVAREALGARHWAELEKKKRAFKDTVNSVATDLEVGTADAGLVWDAIVGQMSDRLEAVELPQLKDARGQVTVGVLKTCNNPAAALRFARFLAARDRGLKTFARHHFTPMPDGDLWADGTPKITLFAGAMLEHTIEKTIEDFAEREGLPVGNICVEYNGCGNLVGQMQAGKRPDVFFSCDARYFDHKVDEKDSASPRVRDLFLDATDISANRLVMLVPKGNPKNIRRLKDLAREGMRVGVGDEANCAMGALTFEVWNQNRKRDPGLPPLKVSTTASTGDNLVTQFTAAPSKLDAVIVYVSNTQAPETRALFDLVPIDLDCAVVQPVAPGKGTNHKHLIGRLIRAMKSDASRQRFEANGFTWKGGK
jgi:molybdate transport system substrate-binding protein